MTRFLSLLQNSTTTTLLSFRVKETVCLSGEQRQPEECTFREGGVSLAAWRQGSSGLRLQGAACGPYTPHLAGRGFTVAAFFKISLSLIALSYYKLSSILIIKSHTC